jgi:MFS family permease
VSLLVLAYLAFASIALPDGLLGVAWPSMSGSLGQPISAIGWLLPFGVTSSLLSGASAGFILARIGLGRLLAASTVLSVVALAGYGLASSLWMVLAATTLLAAGSGAIDAGLNAYAARRFTARRITWMHASYGLGAMVGPLLIATTITAGLSWRWTYGFIAVLQAVIAVAFMATSAAWSVNTEPEQAHSATEATTSAISLRQVLRRPGVWRGAALFFLQIGIENTMVLWAFVFLTSGRGLPPGPASLTVSGYWVAQFCRPPRLWTGGRPLRPASCPHRRRHRLHSRSCALGVADLTDGHGRRGRGHRAVRRAHVPVADADHKPTNRP